VDRRPLAQRLGIGAVGGIELSKERDRLIVAGERGSRPGSFGFRLAGLVGSERKLLYYPRLYIARGVRSGACGLRLIYLPQYGLAGSPVSSVFSMAACSNWAAYDSSELLTTSARRRDA